MRKVYASSFVPQSYLAEEILLGTILMVPRIFPHIIQLIQSDFFFLESNQIIYLSIKSIYHENKLNPTELINHLIDNRNLNTIGGINKIVNIMSQSQIFISSTYLNIYLIEIIETIKKHYIKRLLIQYGYNIIELAYRPNICSYSIYNKASNYLSITNDKLPQQNLQNFKDTIGEILLSLKLNKTPHSINSPANIYVPSGFQEIDKLTNGLPNGDLIIIAGRPSTGKTSLVINIAIHILKTTQYGIYIFSLEMSRQQIIYKYLSIINQLPIQNIINNEINNNQINYIYTTCQDLLNSLLYINDTPNTSIDYIEYTAKLLMHHSLTLNVLIIDYLQLIHVNTKQIFNRVQELSYITRKLKILAQYLNIPIIVLSQLNRNIETRINKKPLLSDLRESGCIAYTSSITINIYENSLISNHNKLVLLENQIGYKVTNKIKGKHCLEYTFEITTYTKRRIHLTHNHKLLNYYKWYRQSEYLEDDFISLYDLKTKHILIYKSFIKNLIFNNYSKTYDIQINNHQFFTQDQIILHNSIEQDADIVIMIHKSNNDNDDRISNSQQAVDLILCKNRNGPIGSCNLLFNTTTTTFNNLNSSIS